MNDRPQYQLTVLRQQDERLMDGCERVGESPPEPLADVVWLPGPARLF